MISRRIVLMIVPPPDHATASAPCPRIVNVFPLPVFVSPAVRRSIGLYHKIRKDKIHSILGGCVLGFLFPLQLVQRPPHRRILGEAIRACRKRAGLTQERLAELADLHHNFVGEVERGNMECSLTSMVKLAKALKVRVRDLVREL